MANIEEISGLSQNIYDEYLRGIVRKISTIQTLTGRGNKYGFYFNKAKCMYLAEELKTRIAGLSAPSTDEVRPVLRDIFFLVHAAKHLVKTSCTKKWLHEAFWMGDCNEAFGDVLLDFQAALENIICFDVKDEHDGTSSSTNMNERALNPTTPRYVAELGNEWEATVLEDRTFLISNVQKAVHLECDLRTGERLKGSDLKIAKLLLHKLTGKLHGKVKGEGILLRDVKIRKMLREPEPGFTAVSVIEWGGKQCVMKGSHNHQQATKEAAIMEQLTHPHVVQLLGVAYHKNSWAIWRPASPKVLLEYMARGDLHSLIKRKHKKLTVDMIVSIMLQIAKGMHYIHCRKIAHLDLKSMNIFVATHVVSDLAEASYFHIKIGDFDKSIRCDGPIPDELHNLGTMWWRAPELFKDAPRPVTSGDLDLYKADVYSYAMVCVELLTGKEPFKDECSFQGGSLYKHIAAPNRPSLPEELYPPELVSIIRSCWDADPTRRPSFEGVIKLLMDLKRKMLFEDSFYSVVATREAQEGHMWRKISKWERGDNRKPKKDQATETEGKKSEEAGEIRYPEIEIDTIHPPFTVEGYDALIQLGETVKHKIDDFIKRGTTLGQHMFTSRLLHLQPIFAEFEVQLQNYFGAGSNTQNVSMNVLLFGEVFRVLKKVEFFLAGCTWPALGFAYGPTVTNEGFVSLWRDLQLCVHMMRYSMLQPDSTRISSVEVSNLLAEPSMGSKLDDWSSTFRDACQQDQQKLLQFSASITSITNWKDYKGREYEVRKFTHFHWYLARIAFLDGVPNPSDESEDKSNKFPEYFDEIYDQVYLGEGPESVVLGPVPFLSEDILESVIEPFVYHQPAVNWAIKVYACKSRKMAYKFNQLASLHHPHVVQIFGHREHGKSGYVAMKMMQANLTQFLSHKQDQVLNPPFLVGILLQIAEGMSYLHSHFVCHHNLKCSNVLVGGCYESLELAHVEVADYGFQRQPLSSEEDDVDSESSSRSLRSTMYTEGTIQYGEGDEGDGYAFDVYQFAMLCLEIFSIRGCGEDDQAPLLGATAPESSKLDEAVPAHSTKIWFPSKCPSDLALFLQKCAAKNPQERPKFPEICTTLQNHKAFMILTGNQGA